MGPGGMSCRRLQIEPNAQAAAANSNAAAAHGEPRNSPPLLSSTTPMKPTIKPAISVRRNFSP